MTRRVLITGMSGTGKSSVIEALAARGHRAIDLDDPEWSEYAPYTPHPDVTETDPPDREWVWRAAKVARLLERDRDELLFVSGTASNMGRFYEHFDHVVLLSAPRAVLTKRLATRTTNDFGKDPDDLARILSDVEAVEPLLRRRASHEIVTDRPLDEVVARILAIVEGT